MTKIAVAGPASGTGTFTLTTPVSSTDRTLTFPDSTGTVLNDQSDIESQVKTATNASGDAPIYSCRAWCNFNGTGTVAIRASGNVSSITDNGTGVYSVNFTASMPDANFSAVAAQTTDGYASRVDAHATGAVRVVTFAGAAVADAATVSVVIFR